MIGHNLHMDILHIINQFFTPIPSVCLCLEFSIINFFVFMDSLMMNINQLLKQQKRSFKRRKSSLLSLSSNMTVDENFCPYTRKILSNDDDDNEEEKMKKKFEIGCPMENNCADLRIVNSILLKSNLKNNNKYK